MKKLKTSLLKVATNETERKSLESAIRNSTVLRDRIDAILNEYLEDLNLKDIKEEDFEDASWPYKQAFRNGERAIIKRIKDLIDF